MQTVAISAQAISCSNARGVFPVHEFFWFCLVQLSTTKFCSFPLVLMGSVDDGSDVPMSPALASSSNMGSPNGSVPDLEGTGFRASTMEEKINEIYLQLPLFIQNAARIENCVQTLAQTVAAQTTKITNIEQIVGSPVARGTSLETNTASGSSGADLSRSWNMLDIVTAPQPLDLSGRMAQGHLMTIEIRDVGLTLSQALRTNMRGAPSYYVSRVNSTRLELLMGSIIFGKRQTYQLTINLSEYIAKQVPCQPGSHSKQEPSVRTLWPDIKMMVSPTNLIVLFAKAESLSLSASPSHLKTRKLENNLRFFGKFCPQSYLNSSQKEVMQAPSLSLHLTPVRKFSASKIEETALENLCSNLLHLEAHSCLHLFHLTCVFLVFLKVCYNGSSLKSERPMCDGRPFAAWRVEAPFSAVSLSDGSYTLRFL